MPTLRCETPCEADRCTARTESRVTKLCVAQSRQAFSCKGRGLGGDLHFHRDRGSSVGIHDEFLLFLLAQFYGRELGRFTGERPGSHQAVRRDLERRSRHGSRLKLIVRGVHKTNPEMLLPLIACFVEAGDPVTVIGGRFTYREVVVSSGPRRGCTRMTAMEFVGQ